MLLLCVDSINLAHIIIFCNTFSTANYPDMWKLANVTTPTFKKGDQYLSFLFVVKFLKKLFLTIFTTILLHNTLDPNAKLDFDLVIPLQTN